MRKQKRQSRDFLNVLMFGFAVVLGATPATVIHAAGPNSWYFTASEIEAAYRYQERFGQRLLRPIKPAECNFGKDEFPASYQGKEFLVPCRFITETKRHLKSMIEMGAARYLFPLDADHAHLAIPREIWDAKYHDLPVDRQLEEAFKDPQLVALYHTAEHLTISDSTNGTEVSESREWRDKRNVLGFFDGRPLTILPPNPDGSAQAPPEQYRNVATVYFLAHRLGEVIFSVRGEAISFDLSFDEESRQGFFPRDGRGHGGQTTSTRGVNAGRRVRKANPLRGIEFCGSRLTGRQASSELGGTLWQAGF